MTRLCLASVAALVLFPLAAAAGDPADRAAAPPPEHLAVQPSCTFSLSSSQIHASASGASAQVDLTTQPGCLWTVSSTSSWAVIDQPAAAYGEGSGSISFHVASNTGPPRVTLLQAGPATIRVSQSGRSPEPLAAFKDVWGGVQLSRYGSNSLMNGGGAFDSNPAAARAPNGDVFFACRDLWNAIWASVYRASAGTWETWRFGGGLTAGQPSIAVAPNGTAYIAVRDAWNSYWLLTYNGTSFGAWIPLHGVFATDPAIAAAGDGSVYVIGKDNWNGLWSGRVASSGVFQGWRFGGGIVQGAPAVAGGAGAAAYVVVRDPWNAVWMARVQGESWLSWSNGGGILSLDPMAAADAQGVVFAVVRDPWGSWWSRGFTEETSSGWLDWAATGGSLIDASPTAGPGGLFLAGRDAAGAFWWYGRNANLWSNMGWSGTLGGPPAAPK
jgi:hypothetical protein